MQLVGGQRKHVDCGVAQGDRQATDRLDGVGVEQRADRLGLLRQLLDRKDDAGLVVGPHDRRQRHSAGKRRAIARAIKPPEGVDGNAVNLDAARAFEMRTQRQNRRMLDRRDDDLVARVGGLERAEDGGVVGSPSRRR